MLELVGSKCQGIVAPTQRIPPRKFRFAFRLFPTPLPLGDKPLRRMAATNGDNPTPANQQPQMEAMGRPRLQRKKAIMAGCALGALGIFYGGPVVLQSTLNRRPPEKLVQSQVSALLPRSLHVGDWREVSTIRFSYQRKQATDWKEDLVASGDWRVEAKVDLRQKVDLFQPDDFGAHARTVRDDSATFADAARQAERLVSKRDLPEVPSVPSLFALATAAGETTTANVSFDIRRWGYSWLGPSPMLCWQCWNALFSETRGWTVNLSVPATEVPVSNSGPQRLRARTDLPNDGLVVGDPRVDKAVADYLAARAAYVTAVKRETGKQQLARLNGLIRSEAERQVATQFYPANGWKIDSLETITDPLPPDERNLEKRLQISLQRTQPLFKGATAEEAARVIPSSAEFTEAQKTAQEFFPAVAASWPQTPQVYVVSRPRGELVSQVVSTKAHNDGKGWILDEIAWPESEIVAKNPAIGLAASEIKGDPIFGGEDRASIAKATDWLRRQTEAIAGARAAEKRMTERFGGDQAAWRVLFKAFAAVGGVDQLRQVTTMTEQVRTKMSWSWLFVNRDAEGSGTIFWKARPLVVENKLNVSFRFKPLLGAEETIAFITVDSTDTSRSESETMNCFAITSSGRRPLQGTREVLAPARHRFYLNRAYAAQLLWHLAVDDESFEVKPIANTSNFTVKVAGLPQFRVAIDPTSGNVQSVNYNEYLGENEPTPIVWQFDGYRKFSDLTLPTRREVLIDGKRNWLYEVTDLKYATAPAVIHWR